MSAAAAPFPLPFTAACIDPIEARIAELAYTTGQRFWRMKRRAIARTIGCCVRILTERFKRLEARGWFTKISQNGQCLCFSIDLDRMEADLLRLGLFTNRSEDFQQPERTTAPRFAPLVHNGASVVESPPGQTCDVCPHCGYRAVENATESQQVRPEPRRDRSTLEQTAAPGPSKDSREVNRNQKSSSNTAVAPVFGERPKTLDEVFPDGKPKLRPVLVEYRPHVQMQIPWEHSEADYQTAERWVRWLSDKWFSGTYASVPVDRACLHGILQAAPVALVEAEARRLQSLPNVKPADPNRVQTYLRAALWEKARGIKWSDLPYEFTRDRIRKPMASEQSIDVAAALKRF